MCTVPTLMTVINIWLAGLFWLKIVLDGLTEARNFCFFFDRFIVYGGEHSLSIAYGGEWDQNGRSQVLVQQV